MSAALVQAVPPTARAMRWSPLVVAAGLLLAAALLARAAGRPADTLLEVTAVTLASLLVAGLHDPAAGLLAAVPVSVSQRRGLRLGLALVPAVALWLALTSVVPAGSQAPSLLPLLALAAAGAAVAAWAPERVGVLLGTFVPPAWFALAHVAGDGVVAEVAAWWRTEPAAVLVVSLVLAGLTRGRR